MLQETKVSQHNYSQGGASVGVGMTEENSWHLGPAAQAAEYTHMQAYLPGSLLRAHK